MTAAPATNANTATDAAGRAEAYARNIARMIELKTIAQPEYADQFARLHALLAEMFPHVHETCELANIEGSLLYRWKGKSPEGALLLMSHHDVVPADASQWATDPFVGVLKDGKLWGRGAIDVKANLYCIFQAMEDLIAEGFEPDSDVYLVSSNCEEVGGNDAVARHLHDTGASIGLLLDEGSSVQPCQLPFANCELAHISTAEKGFINVRCTTRSAGGHASAPGPNTPLVRLGAFMADIDANSLFPVRASKPLAEFFESVAPYLPTPDAERLLRLAHAETPDPADVDDDVRDMMKTTVAFTMAGGSSAPNVLPTEAWVVCNVRIEPGRTVGEVMEALAKRAEPYGIELEEMMSNDPSPVSSSSSADFQRVKRAVGVAYPGVGVVPFMLSGGTDTKHFMGLYRSCLRFTALRITTDQSKRCHGNDENVDVSTLANAVDFFRAVITDCGA